MHSFDNLLVRHINERRTGAMTLPADFPPMPDENASLAAVLTWLIDLIRWWVARAAAREAGETAGDCDPGLAPTPPLEGLGCSSPDGGEPEGKGSRREAKPRRAVASLLPIGAPEPAEVGGGTGRGAGPPRAALRRRRGARRERNPPPEACHRPGLHQGRRAGCDPPPLAGRSRKSGGLAAASWRVCFITSS